jgi:hypothetical protein
MTMLFTRMGAISAVILRILSFGWIRLDRPRGVRLRQMRIFHRWALGIEARYRGRRDGKLLIPRRGEKRQPPEVWKLKQQADGVLRRIAATWSDADARLRGEYQAIAQEHDNLLKKVENLERELKDEHERFRRRRDTLDKEKEKDEAREAEERWRIPTWLYAVAITIIFAGEFPLNAVAFNLFGEDRVFTYIMTTGLAAALVLCAHALGVLWRMKNPSARDEVVARVLLVFPVLVIVGIGIIREVYIEEFAGGSIGGIGPIGNVLIFIVMNLVIFVAALVISYLHHDPEGRLLDRLAREVRISERRLHRKKRAIEREVWLLRFLQNRRELWRTARRGAYMHSRFHAYRHKDIYEALTQAYWSANRTASERRVNRDRRRWERASRWRGERAGEAPQEWKPPHAMEKLPEISVPHVFASEDGDGILEWEREQVEKEQKGTIEAQRFLRDVSKSAAAS